MTLIAKLLLTIIGSVFAGLGGAVICFMLDHAPEFESEKNKRLLNIITILFAVSLMFNGVAAFL